MFDWVDTSAKIVYEAIYATAAPPPAEGSGAEAPQVPATRAVGTSDPHPAAPATAKSGGESGSFRVATEKVDHLINLVGELVITQSML